MVARAVPWEQRVRRTGPSLGGHQSPPCHGKSVPTRWWDISTLWHQPCGSTHGPSTDAQQQVWEVGNISWAGQLTKVFLLPWCRQGTGLGNADRRHSSRGREWDSLPREEGLLKPWWQLHCANFGSFIAISKNKPPVRKMIKWCPSHWVKFWKPVEGFVLIPKLWTGRNSQFRIHVFIYERMYFQKPVVQYKRRKPWKLNTKGGIKERDAYSQHQGLYCRLFGVLQETPAISHGFSTPSALQV